MILFICLLIFIAILLIVAGISSFSKAGGLKTRLPQEPGQADKTNIPAYTLPFSKKFLAKFRLDVKIKNKLDAARVKLTPAGYFSIKVLFMLALGFFSIFVLGRFVPPIFFIGLAMGFILPDIYLNRRVTKRKYQIRRLLPETVDLLALCVEAGLDFTSALKWIIEKKIYSNPLIEELSFVLEEIKWGKPRSQALKDMAKRLNIMEVSSFVRLLLQAERMGTPVAETFGIISEDSRLQRFREGERYAMKAPLKILIPLIFCILPVIGIVIGGPIILRFTQGGLFK